MDFNFDTGTISTGLQTLDVSTLPPLGGTAGVLTVIGDGAITLPQGLVGARPAVPLAGMFRFSTSLNLLEFYDGTTWDQLSTSSGSVTSVGVATTTTGLTITGSPITGAGVITVDLNSQLQGLSSLTTTPGNLVQTSPGVFTARTITGTPGTVVVTDGDGVSGNPTITLDTLGTPVSASFVKITTDSFGRVSATTPVVTADITALVDNTYVNVAGDTMATGANLTFVGGGEVLGLPATPSGDTAAASKLYVDSIANGLSWKQAASAASTGDIDLTTGGLLIIDGYQTVAGDRIIVKNQTATADNGIYIVDAGTWVRSTDMDSTVPNEFMGAAVFATNGATQNDTAWVQTEVVTTVGTSPVLFAQFAAAGGYTAGNGLTLTGTVFSLTAPVSTANGGTGLDTSTAADGQILIGNGAGLSLGTITGGTGITVTNAAGAITIDVDNTELVTSVTGTANQITATPTVGDVALSIPSAFIAPGSIRATTTLTVDTLTPNASVYATTGGQLVSTAALTNGQILIGSTGNAPVAGTITGGTGVTVTNAAGTITIDVDDTEVVTSFSAGGTGFTPVAATSGDVVLGGTLNPANGGTGIDTSGATNGQVLIGNGTGLSLATLTAGTGIGIANGAGSITLTNGGVTGFSLNTVTSADAAVLTVTPTTSGTGDIAATVTFGTQTANTILAGPATGAAAQPTFRALTLDDLGSALQLYTENPSTPTAPSATGLNAVAIGSGSVASAVGSFAVGQGADARILGQKAYANGSFATAGDAQRGVYVMRNTTADNAYTDLFIDGIATQLVIPDNSLFVFDILVAGRRTDADGGGAGYRFLGVAKKDATAGSITFVGNPSKTVIGETNSPWDARVSVDAATGAVRIEVRGENSKNINWVATLTTTEVTN
jgi:hypothetical protein